MQETVCLKYECFLGKDTPENISITCTFNIEELWWTSSWVTAEQLMWAGKIKWKRKKERKWSWSGPKIEGRHQRLKLVTATGLSDSVVREQFHICVRTDVRTWNDFLLSGMMRSGSAGGFFNRVLVLLTCKTCRRRSRLSVFEAVSAGNDTRFKPYDKNIQELLVKGHCSQTRIHSSLRNTRTTKAGLNKTTLAVIVMILPFREDLNHFLRSRMSKWVSRSAEVPLSNLSGCCRAAGDLWPLCQGRRSQKNTFFFSNGVAGTNSEMEHVGIRTSVITCGLCNELH